MTDVDDSVVRTMNEKAMICEGDMTMTKKSAASVRTKIPTAVSVIWIAVLFVASAIVYAHEIHQTDSLLWEKAKDYMSQVHWIPREIVEHERIYDLKGGLEEASRFVLGLSPGKNGLVRLRVIAAEENGEDVARQARSAFDGEVPLDELMEESPFTPKTGHRVTYREKGKHRRINNHHCTEFQFSMRIKDGTVEGTVWLDQKTGLPVEMHTRITSVPFMEEDLKINAYKSFEYFTITAQGHCLWKKSKVEMEIEVPQTGFKGRVINESVGTDHWKYDRAQ